VSIFEKWRDLARISAYREPWWDEIEGRTERAVFGDYDAEIEAEIRCVNEPNDIPVATFNLYVGDWKGDFNKRLGTDILQSRHAGYTITTAQGSWEGATEKTAVITISGTREDVRATAVFLAEALHQTCVGFVRIGDTMEMVTP
jgi:hypothetical protein